MALSALARLSIVAAVLSGISLGATGYTKMQFDEADRVYNVISAGPTYEGDAMMAAVHSDLVYKAHAKKVDTEEDYLRVSRLTLTYHAVAAAIAVMIWIALGFRKSGPVASPSQ